ncbi:MAG TPA: response regulator transcription factor, partial [Negativicutes bacterium]
MKLKVLIIDDHEIFRKGIRKLLEQADWVASCADVDNLISGLDLIAKSNPDILLLDLYLGKQVSAHIVPTIRACSANTKIIVLTVSEESEDIRLTAHYHVDGYLLKSTSFSHLEEYIKAIHKGQLCVSDPLARILFQDLIETENHKVLTPREKDVLDFLCKGFSNREIA